MAIESLQFERNRNEQPTAAESVAVPSLPPATAQQLIPRVSNLRVRADAVNSTAAFLHHEVYSLHLGERTAALEHKSVQSLIESLADKGLAWSDMASMLGVSVPAIRKWRQGEGATPANRNAVAQLAALLDVLDTQLMIEDPAAWLEIPLAGTRTTLADIYVAGRLDLILDYAIGWLRPADKLLDAFAPGWRATEAKKEFETFVAGDGQLGIRRIHR